LIVTWLLKPSRLELAGRGKPRNPDAIVCVMGGGLAYVVFFFLTRALVGVRGDGRDYLFLKYAYRSRPALFFPVVHVRRQVLPKIFCPALH
jgi:hypothetical protein